MLLKGPLSVCFLSFDVESVHRNPVRVILAEVVSGITPAVVTVVVVVTTAILADAGAE